MRDILILLCCFYSVGIDASPFEAGVSGGHNVIHNLWPRVDATSCRSMTYQVMACKNHGFSLLDKNGEELVELLAGGWENTESRLSIKRTGYQKRTRTPDIFQCGEYRRFWMSWGNSAVRYGKGSVVGGNIIFNITDITGQDVKRLGLKAVQHSPAKILLGESDRGRFELMSNSGKLSNGLIKEIAASMFNCSWRCTVNADCGIFSFNQDQGLCAIYDRMVSTFSVTPLAGWKSWRMMYCYP